MNTAWKLLSISAAAAMLAACSHTTTREVVREQPIVQQAPERVTVSATPPRSAVTRGVPLAMASKADSPNVSREQGAT